MPLVLQCQACSRSTDAPSSWGYYKGPWRCDYCQARHSIECSLGNLHAMQLDDRFTPGHVACSDPTASDIREAIAAFNAYAPRAAVVMIRRALERACSEKGARGKKLWEKIKDLHERAGYFDDAHVALATGTRLFGNLSAHPGHDLLEDISDDEARRALDLGLYLIKKMCSPKDNNS